jgi:hypothetical protein
LGEVGGEEGLCLCSSGAIRCAGKEGKLEAGPTLRWALRLARISMAAGVRLSTPIFLKQTLALAKACLLRARCKVVIQAPTRRRTATAIPLQVQSC